MNQNLTNLRIEAFNENIRLNFSRDWDSSSSEVVEDIWPGRVVKEEGGSVSVWYSGGRYGNKLVKQASKGKTPAHTVTREFTGTEMITSFSTDNNSIKASVVHTRII